VIEIEATQRCRTCGEVKPLSEFDFRSDSGRYKTECKKCRRAYQRQRWAAAPERQPRLFRPDAMFVCTRCGELKPAAEFPPRLRGARPLQSWCRPCFRQHNARNYAANSDRERARTRRNRNATRAENRARLDEYLRGHPCVDCGEMDIVVLEFDHLRDKKRNVSEMLHLSWQRISEEIAKCEVRCANDHRRKTEERRLERAVREPSAAFRAGRGERLSGPASVEAFRDPGESRTRGLLIRSQPLYPLSYRVEA
jgi:hypothetical protein